MDRIVLLTGKLTLGQYVSRRMEDLRLSTRDLDKLTGVSYGYISKIARDEIRAPSVEKLAMLAKGLQVPPENLFRLAGGLQPHGEGGESSDITAAVRRFAALPPDVQADLLADWEALLDRREHQASKGRPGKDQPQPGP